MKRTAAAILFVAVIMAISDLVERALSASLSPADRAEAVNGAKDAESAFVDSLESLNIDDERGRAAKPILQELARAYKACNPGSLQPILSETFTDVLVGPKGQRWQMSRNAYLAGVPLSTEQVRSACEGLNRELRFGKIAFVDPPKNAASNTLVITSVSTYSSRYFSPRFLETIVLRRREERIILARRIRAPLHPGSRLQIQVEAVFGGLAEFEALHDARLKTHPEDTDLLLQHGLSRKQFANLAVDRVKKAVIFYFKEPPPPHSNVSLKHEYYDLRRRMTGSHSEEHVSGTIDPWPLLITTSSFYAEGSVRYVLGIDGTTVYDKRFENRR